MLDMKKIRKHHAIYATVLVVIVLLLAIVVNMVCTVAEEKVGLNVDLTKHRLYSLSEASEELVGSLTNDVYIYSLYNAGSMDAAVEKLLEQYDRLSERLIWENIDPALNPTFTQRFDPQNQGIQTGSVIVSSEHDGNHFYRILSPTDFIAIDYSTYTVTGLNVEAPITSAIRYVSTGVIQNVYVLTGHGETKTEDMLHLTGTLANQNCLVSGINLLTDSMALDPTRDILAVIGPKEDLQDREYAIIQEFIEAGGDLFCAFDPVFSSKMENWNLLLRNYCMHMEQNVVVEGNENKYYNTPNILLPDMVQHTITEPMIGNGVFPMLPISLSITVDQSTFTNYAQAGGILVTSGSSYAKASAEAMIARELGDAVGPFNVGAVGIRINEETEATSRIVVLGSSQGVTLQTFFELPGNTALVQNSFSWLAEQGELLPIQAKPLYDDSLTFPSQAIVNIISVLLIGCIPAACIGIGYVVWARRRRG